MHELFNRLINSLFDAVETKALKEIKRVNVEKHDLYSIPTLRIDLNNSDLNQHQQYQINHNGLTCTKRIILS